MITRARLAVYQSAHLFFSSLFGSGIPITALSAPTCLQIFLVSCIAFGLLRETWIRKNDIAVTFQDFESLM